MAVAELGKGPEITTGQHPLRTPTRARGSTDLPAVLRDEFVLLHGLLDESPPASDIRRCQQQVLEPRREENGSGGQSDRPQLQSSAEIMPQVSVLGSGQCPGATSPCWLPPSPCQHHPVSPSVR